MPTHPRRRWFQFAFGLRTLFVVMTIAVDPVKWPPPKGFLPVEIEGKINGNNVTVSGRAKKVSVWLAPELVDVTKPITIRINGRKLNVKAQDQPELEVLLEDVRSRGERLHPFWMKYE